MADQAPVTADRIGVSRTNGLLSRLIRLVTASQVSHAFVVYYDQEFAQDMVLEAVGAGFRIQSLDVFRSQNEIVLLYHPRHPLTAGYPVVARWLGQPYDTGGLCGMFWVLVGRWLRRRWANPLASGRALFCSEAVVRLLLAANYPNLPASFSRPETISPDDLLQWMDTGP